MIDDDGTVELARVRPGVLAVAVLAVGLVIAGSSRSWACVPQPLLTIQPRASAAPGDQVTVDGLHFSGRVEIRWNASDGLLLATANGSPFSVRITVPEVADGLYALIAFERDEGGGIVGVTRASFDVTASGNPTSARVATSSAVDRRRSSASGFTTGLGIIAGVVLFVSGGVAGAALVRRHARRSEPEEDRSGARTS